jgi:hypothetical protein
MLGKLLRNDPNVSRNLILAIFVVTNSVLMNSCRANLIVIAASSVCSRGGSESLVGVPFAPRVSAVLLGEPRTLLETKNGFYAFESALHVFSACSHADHLNLAVWNAPNTWKRRARVPARDGGAAASRAGALCRVPFQQHPGDPLRGLGVGGGAGVEGVVAAEAGGGDDVGHPHDRDE